MMYSDEGILVESGRPLVENLICEYRARSVRFWFYMDELVQTIYNSPDRSPMVIEISVDSSINLGQGKRAEHDNNTH